MTTAARLLHKNNRKMDVLCVAPELVLDADAGGSPEKRRRRAERYRHEAAQDGERIVARAERLLRGEGVEVSRVVAFGSPADEILQRTSDYDLLVIGAHGRDERKQPGLGPVSSRIVQNARCSVLVGRELANDANYRVLVAIDGSTASFDALASLRQFFDVSTLDVTLMSVLEMPWARLDMEAWTDSEAGASEERSGYQRELERELREDADAAIDRALTLLGAWDVSATTVVEEGDPALEISGHVEQGTYDLVVVGATGSSDMKHALLGSVSLKLAWNCPCSVLIVRK
jgi:nucleotide-binding universal stress UspA family protein